MVVHNILCKSLFVFISFGLSNCDLNLPNGAACITDGFNGTCVSLRKCPSASLTNVFHNAGYADDEDIAKFPDVCSRTANETIVCCTDCKIEDKEVFNNTVILPNGSLYWKRGPKAKDMCYDYFQKLPYKCRGGANVLFKKQYVEDRKCHDLTIGAFLPVGGRNAERWEFPHMALLGYGDERQSAQWLCGGTIISERFILTAGHCISSSALGPVTFVALGLLKRSDPPEYWKVYKIKNIIKHPEYKPPGKYHDIALLETEEEINFGVDILPACLGTDVADKSSVFLYDQASASGWGREGHYKDLADTLQVIDVEQFSEEECSMQYQPHRHLKQGYNHTIQMCYGSKTAVIDTCQGDSGGPLQTNMEKCLYTIRGVTSFGRECGVLGAAGVYTRVAHYVPWIESVVWPN